MEVARTAVGGVLAIVFVALGKIHRAYHIEGEVKLATALTQEVVAHAALESHAVGEILCVGHVVIQRTVVTILELQVGEVGQDDESAVLAFVVLEVAQTGAPVKGGAAQAQGLLLLEVDFLKYVLGGEAEAASVVGLPVAQVLIALELDEQAVAFLCLEEACQLARGRDGQHLEGW